MGKNFPPFAVLNTKLIKAIFKSVSNQISIHVTNNFRGSKFGEFSLQMLLLLVFDNPIPKLDMSAHCSPIACCPIVGLCTVQTVVGQNNLETL